MKRFIRYLYEYENEKRIRNVGFIKVETGYEETIVHMQAKGFHDSNERRLVLYLFYEENGIIVGISQREEQLTSPALSWHFTFGADDVCGREYYSKICGVLIETGSGRRIAATWDDRNVDVSRLEMIETEEEDSSAPGREEEAAGRDTPGEAGSREEVAVRDALGGVNITPAPEVAGCEEEAVGCRDAVAGRDAPGEEVYAQGDKEKQQIKRNCSQISRQDISKLPHCEWKLANNQFLRHGYNNFHHLLLIDDGIHLKLGVPGIYHIKEAKCADMFGFEEFLSAEELGIFSELEENQDELFGYWCRLVRRRRTV